MAQRRYGITQRGGRVRRQQGGRGRRRYQRGSRQMGREYAGHSHGLGMAVSGSTWAGYHGHNVMMEWPFHQAAMSGGLHPHNVTPWGSPEFSSVPHDHILGGGSSIHTPGGAHPHYMSSSYDAGHAHGVSGLGEHQHGDDVDDCVGCPATWGEVGMGGDAPAGCCLSNDDCGSYNKFCDIEGVSTHYPNWDTTGCCVHSLGGGTGGGILPGICPPDMTQNQCKEWRTKYTTRQKGGKVKKGRKKRDMDCLTCGW